MAHCSFQLTFYVSSVATGVTGWLSCIISSLQPFPWKIVFILITLKMYLTLMDSDSVFQSGVRIPISIPISNLSNSWVPEYAEVHLQSFVQQVTLSMCCVSGTTLSTRYLVGNKRESLIFVGNSEGQSHWTSNFKFSVMTLISHALAPFNISRLNLLIRHYS